MLSIFPDTARYCLWFSAITLPSITFHERSKVRVLRGYTFENKKSVPTVFEDAATPLITKVKTVFKFDKWKWSHFHLTTFGEVIFAWT